MRSRRFPIWVEFSVAVGTGLILMGAAYALKEPESFKNLLLLSAFIVFILRLFPE